MLTCVPVDELDRLASLAGHMHLIDVEGIRMQDNRRTRIPLRKTVADQTLDRAVQRIYEMYGSDLTRFFAAVEKQRTQQLREAAEVREDNAAQERGARTSASDQARQ